MGSWLCLAVWRLLGADGVGEFDHLFDLPNETLTLSAEELTNDGYRTLKVEWCVFVIENAVRSEPQETNR